MIRLNHKFIFLKYLTRKSVTLIFLFIILFNFLILNYSSNNQEDSNNYTTKRISREFSPQLSTTRLNRLFKILQLKENDLSLIFDKLKVISFNDLALNRDKLSKEKQSLYRPFESQIKNFLKITDRTVESTDNFIDYLSNISKHYSFKIEERSSVVYRSFNKVCFKLLFFISIT